MATQYRVNSVDIDVDNNKVLIEAQDMDFLYTVESLDAEFESPTEIFEFSGISQLRYLYKIAQNNKQIRNRKLTIRFADGTIIHFMHEIPG